MSAFQIIDKETFESSHSDRVEGAGVGGDNQPATDNTYSRIYCDFCKGHYIEEYHVERWEGVKS